MAGRRVSGRFTIAASRTAGQVCGDGVQERSRAGWPGKHDYADRVDDALQLVRIGRAQRRAAAIAERLPCSCGIIAAPQAEPAAIPARRAVSLVSRTVV